MEYVELVYVLKELRPWNGSKIQKVYQHEDTFCLQLYRAELGKVYLVVKLPDALYLTEEKPPLPETLSALGVRLRKHWTNTTLEKIDHVANERIVRLVLRSKEETSHIFIELFGKGNLVICDSANKIILPWKSESFTARTLTRGELYVLPPPRDSIFTLSQHDFYALVSKIEKNISTTLAKQGLGAKYAREVCVRAGVDPLATTVKGKEEALHDEVAALLEHPIEAAVVNSEAEPFPLESVVGDRIARDTFGAAIVSTLNWKKGPSKQEKEIKRIQAIIDAQRKNEERLVEEVITSTKKAELLYEHYEMVKEIIDLAREHKDVKAAIGKFPSVKKIDMKEKKVTLVLE